MSDMGYAVLAERGILRLAGPDAKSFLQGLVSNDVTRVGPDRAIYAALLTPQGKFLHDFIIAEHEGALLLDCEGARTAELLRRLTLYKLRAKVTLEDVSRHFRVIALFGADAPEITPLPGAESLGTAEGAAMPHAGGVLFRDPRVVALGARALLPVASWARTLETSGLPARSVAEYDRHRLGLGVPDGSRDLEVDRALLLECNFEALHGVDFAKGCYMGQELTARTKYRGLVRKRLFRVDIEGPLPAPGTLISQDGKEAGFMRSGSDDIGLALLRLEAVERAGQGGAPLTADQARLTPIASGVSELPTAEAPAKE